jgi:hypothetical protein
MATLHRVNSRSTAHSGDLVLPENRNRGYFFIVMTAGIGTIEFGGGGGLIPLATGEHYNPPVAPTSEISIVTTGDFVLHMA